MKKFKKGQEVNLSIGGNTGKYRFIGEGSFAMAFLDLQDNDSVYLIVPDSEFGEDKAKNVLADAYFDNPYLPKVEFFGYAQVLGKESRVFVMPYYQDISVKDPAWIEVKKLHKIRDDCMHETTSMYKAKTGERGSLTFLGHDMNGRIVKRAKEKKLNPDLVKALKALHETAKKTTSPGMSFEFNKDNVGVRKDGQLILRDPLYDAEMAVEIKDAMKKQGKKPDEKSS
jgi:hypothetical protein